MKKKIVLKALSFMLSAAMVLSTVPVPVMAQQAEDISVVEISTEETGEELAEDSCDDAECEEMEETVETEESDEIVETETGEVEYPLGADLDLFALDWKNADNDTINHYLNMSEWMNIGMWLKVMPEEDKAELLARDTILNQPTYIEEPDGNTYEMLYYEYAQKVYGEHDGEVFDAYPQAKSGYWTTIIERKTANGSVDKTATITHKVSGIDKSKPTTERQSVTITKTVQNNWCNITFSTEDTHKSYKDSDGTTYPFTKSIFAYVKPAGYKISTTYSLTQSFYKMYWRHSIFDGANMTEGEYLSTCRHVYPNNTTCNGVSTSQMVSTENEIKNNIACIVNMYVNAGIGTTANPTRGNLVQKITLNPIAYNVAYHGNGATSGGTAAQNGCYYNAKYTTPANGFSRSYTVTFDGNGGASNVASLTANYDFAGWGLNNTTTVNYGVGATYSNLAKTNGATANMYAIWTPKAVTLPGAMKEGYQFQRWNVGLTGREGETYVPTANVKATASWKANTYRVVLDPKNGAAQQTINATYDTAFTLPTPERAGYRFAGWTGEGGTFSGVVKNLTSQQGGVVNLSAVWESKDDIAYTINRFKQKFQNVPIDVNDENTYTKLDEKDALPATEICYGKAGEMITVPAGSMEGYITPDAQIVTIEGDGSTVVNFYYTLDPSQIDIEYRVEHYIKKSPAGSYEIFKTEKAFAKEGEVIAPALNQEAIKAVNAIAGCMCKEPQIQSMTVKEGLVIKYYYDCIKEDATTGNLSEDTLNEIAKKLAAGLSFSLDINGTEYEIIQNDDGTLGIKFTNATSEKVVIPDVIKVGDKVYRITEIHEKAFQNNTTLKEVELSANIQKVGDQAFKGCTSLEKVTMREGLVTIGNEAFKGCTSLKTIKTPSTLQTIGNNAFEGCTSLKKVTLNTGLLKIGNKAFYKCSNLTSVKIPKTVLKMGQYAFGSCKKLKKVTFAQTSQLLTMGKGIFSHCVVLKEIKLPNKLRNVPEKGFYNCKKLNKVTIGEKVTTISESAFEKCVKITSIKIPSKVQTIRKKAFYGCKSLKKVDIRSKALTSVGSKAFKGCKKGIKFAVPKAKMSSYKKLFKGKY